MGNIFSDPTANTAIANVTREENRKKREAERAARREARRLEKQKTHSDSNKNRCWLYIAPRNV